MQIALLFVCVANAEGRITKPARRTVSVPYKAGDDASAFVARVAAKFPNQAAQLIVVRNFM